MEVFGFRARLKLKDENRFVKFHFDQTWAEDLTDLHLN